VEHVLESDIIVAIVWEDRGIIAVRNSPNSSSICVVKANGLPNSIPGKAAMAKGASQQERKYDELQCVKYPYNLEQDLCDARVSV